MSSSEENVAQPEESGEDSSPESGEESSDSSDTDSSSDSESSGSGSESDARPGPKSIVSAVQKADDGERKESSKGESSSEDEEDKHRQDWREPEDRDQGKRVASKIVRRHSASSDSERENRRKRHKTDPQEERQSDRDRGRYRREDDRNEGRDRRSQDSQDFREHRERRYERRDNSRDYGRGNMDRNRDYNDRRMRDRDRTDRDPDRREREERDRRQRDFDNKENRNEQDGSDRKRRQDMDKVSPKPEADKGEIKEEENYMKTKRAKMGDDLMTKTGGAYIPPARLRMMQAQITDKQSIQFQRLAWEALKKSLNGLINKVNVSNIILVVRELFQENIVRGRGLVARSIIQAQAASPTFTHVYAALVAIINTKFPENGLLILKRLSLQFKKGFKRNDKNLCLSSCRFVAHLVNQQVAHEILALEILTLLLENPTDDSVEVAVGFMKESGAKLTEVSPRGVHAIFDRLRTILHEATIDKRVQYMIEVMFAVRKDGFKDHPSVLEELDLVEEEDQFTHMLTLDDAVNSEDMLNIFKLDPDYEATEEKYKTLKKEILDEGSSDDESRSGSESGSESSDESDQEGEATTIIDQTETNLIAFRRMVYLTIQSSLDFEECCHKLLKLDIKPGFELELCNMILDCCAQQRTYEKFFGLLAQRFCMLDKKYITPFQQMFGEQYALCHRLETNKLRNISKFFAHLLHTDAISWEVLHDIKLNEDDTTSSSRIFIKIMFQELSEYMGLPKLHDRLNDVTLAIYFEGLFPRDNPKNTRFAINFFTSIGLGGLTDELRAHLKTMPKVPIIPPKEEDKSSSGSDSSSDSSSDSDSSSSDSSSSSSSSSSATGENWKKVKRHTSIKDEVHVGNAGRKEQSNSSRRRSSPERNPRNENRRDKEPKFRHEDKESRPNKKQKDVKATDKYHDADDKNDRDRRENVAHPRGKDTNDRDRRENASHPRRKDTNDRDRREHNSHTRAEDENDRDRRENTSYPRAHDKNDSDRRRENASYPRAEDKNNRDRKRDADKYSRVEDKSDTDRIENLSHPKAKDKDRRRTRENISQDGVEEQNQRSTQERNNYKQKDRHENGTPRDSQKESRNKDRDNRGAQTDEDEDLSDEELLANAARQQSRLQAIQKELEKVQRQLNRREQLKRARGLANDSGGERDEDSRESREQTNRESRKKESRKDRDTRSPEKDRSKKYENHGKETKRGKRDLNSSDEDSPKKISGRQKERPRHDTTSDSSSSSEDSDHDRRNKPIHSRNGEMKRSRDRDSYEKERRRSEPKSRERVRDSKEKGRKRSAERTRYRERDVSGNRRR